MNRDEFVERVYERSRSEFKGNEATIYIQDCKDVLPQTGVDYEKLYRLILTDYKYKSAPALQWLCENLSKCRAYSHSSESDGIGTVKCLINGYETDFGYLKRECTIKQAIDGLRALTLKEGHTLTILSDIGSL